MRSFVLVVLAACSAPKSQVNTSISTPPPGPTDAPSDAAPDAAPDTELAAAPPSVFRFNAAPRDETWTLRHASGRAEIVIEAAARPKAIYTGTATERGGALRIEAAMNGARQALDCARDHLAVVPATAVIKHCRFEPPTTTQVDVLACKVPGFTVPMPFGSPGVEYVQAAGCATGAGYRALP